MGSCLALGLGLAAPASSEELRIGYISPVTGIFAQVGKDMVDGFQMYLDEHGGKLGGMDVKFIVEDDQGKPDAGVTKVIAAPGRAPRLNDALVAKLAQLEVTLDPGPDGSLDLVRVLESAEALCSEERSGWRVERTARLAAFSGRTVASTRCSITAPKQWSSPSASAAVATPPPVAVLETQ